MRMTKVLIGVIFYCCIYCIGVSASSLDEASLSVRMTSEDRLLYVSGKVDGIEANQDISVLALSKDDGTVYAVMQEKTNADGTFSLAGYISPVKVSATLDILVSGKGIVNSKTVTLYYADENESANIIIAINNAKTADDMHTVLAFYGSQGILNVDIMQDAYIQQAAYVDGLLAASVSMAGFETIDQIENAFVLALIMNETVNANNKFTLLSEKTDSFAFLIDENFDFADIKDKKGAETAINAFITGEISDVWTMRGAYRTAYALTVLNNSLKSEIPTVLADYNDFFKLDLAGDYKKVSSGDVAKVLYDRGYTSLATLKDNFDNAVRNLLANSGGNNGNYTSGGGFGSGRGGTSIISKVLPPVDTLPPSDLEQGNSFVFSDLQDAAWAEEYIVKLAAQGIINGFSDGSFRPNEEVTRGQICKLICIAFSLEPQYEGSAFDDVQRDEWFYTYVTALSNHGIVFGAYDKFLPNDAVTREDAAVMLHRIINNSTSQGGEGSFADEDKISDHAIESVYEMRRAGIISGFSDGTFRPKNNLTRAEAAKIIYEALKGA